MRQCDSAHAQGLPRYVGRHIRPEKDCYICYFIGLSHALHGNACEQSFFDIVTEFIGHFRFDKAGRNGVAAYSA